MPKVRNQSKKIKNEYWKYKISSELRKYEIKVKN